MINKFAINIGLIGFAMINFNNVKSNEIVYQKEVNLLESRQIIKDSIGKFRLSQASSETSSPSRSVIRRPPTNRTWIRIPSSIEQESIQKQFPRFPESVSPDPSEEPGGIRVEETTLIRQFNVCKIAGGHILCPGGVIND